ncbi:MAG: hypothetical protein QW232_05420 [Saccharolobus sp.]
MKKINVQILATNQTIRMIILITAASLPLLLAALHIVHAGEKSILPVTG